MMQLKRNLTPLNLPKGETSDSCHDQYLCNAPLPQKNCENSQLAENLDPIPGYITANPHTYHLIKEIRDTLKEKPTKEEEILWMFLKNKKTGYHIRRQHVIDYYITDFVCLSKKLIIEIDGKIHLKQREHDQLRSFRLNELGYKVIRFTNEEVNEKPEQVALKIKEILENDKHM
jgi:very-short-patch-repair endonuclease